MQITPEQRAEFWRNGFKFSFWNQLLDLENQHGDQIHIDLSMPHKWVTADCSMADLLASIAILGYASPGYRLVPEEVAQEWLTRSYDPIANMPPDGEFFVDAVRALDADKALASALQPTKEVEP